MNFKNVELINEWKKYSSSLTNYMNKNGYKLISILSWDAEDG